MWKLHLALVALTLPLFAQDPSPDGWRSELQITRSEQELRWQRRPSRAAPGAPAPTLLLWGQATAPALGDHWRMVRFTDAPDLPALLLALRCARQPEGCRFHLIVGPDRLAESRVALESLASDFTTVVLLGDAAAIEALQRTDTPTSRSQDLVITESGQVSTTTRAMVDAWPTRSTQWMKAGTDLAPLLRRLRAAQRVSDPREADVHRVLDALSNAATRAHHRDYFALFHPTGVFHGTDESERWPIAVFRDWARPYFRKDRPPAWTFIPVDRSVQLSVDAKTAWFDETVVSAHLGSCRGTGALLRTAHGWRITQYNLAMTVPNPLSRGLVRMVRAGNNEPVRHFTLVPVKANTAPGLQLFPKTTAFTSALCLNADHAQLLRATGHSPQLVEDWNAALGDLPEHAVTRTLIIATPSELSELATKLGATDSKALSQGQVLLVRQGTFGDPETTWLQPR